MRARATRPRATLALALLAVVAGCGGGAESPDATDVADATELDAPGELPPPTAWSDAARLVQLIDDQTLQGDVDQGAILELGWADDPTVNCWSFGQMDRFAGPQVLYALAVPLANTRILRLTLTPAPAVDLNLYAVSQPVGSYHLPPALPAASSCPRSDTGGPGEVEQLTLQNISGAQNWFFAVAAPAGTAAGSFELRVEKLGLEN
ncbi:MAG: hypothetical protein H6746_19785 [Deltaproteobacteria bacterium]|nr:hypothetical protein [Deltaproteobacteria bacterium]